MSEIDTTSLNSNYPVAGVDNDSQGFRDNFTNIKENLELAKVEITDLQNNVIRSDQANDLNGSLLSNVNFLNTSKALYNIGPISGTQNVFYTDGEVQKITLDGNATLVLRGWPDSDKAGELLIHLYSDNGNPYNVIWSTEAGGEFKFLSNWPTTFTVQDEATPVVVKFWTFDGGNVVFAEYVNYIDPSSGSTVTNIDNRELETFEVRIADNGSGTQDEFYLNDIKISDYDQIIFQEKTIYRFDVSDSSNSGAPLRFSTTADSNVPSSITEYTDNVTVVGVAGTAGAYVDIEITPETPRTLYMYAEETTVDTSNIGAQRPITVTGIYRSDALIDEITGDLTGNVTGNLTGTVTGNVTGNLTGNVTGNLDGDITGSVFADDSTLLVDGVNGTIPGYVSISELKTIVANSATYADFQTAIANL